MLISFDIRMTIFFFCFLRANIEAQIQKCNNQNEPYIGKKVKVIHFEWDFSYVMLKAHESKNIKHKKTTKSQISSLALCRLMIYLRDSSF